MRTRELRLLGALTLTRTLTRTIPLIIRNARFETTIHSAFDLTLIDVKEFKTFVKETMVPQYKIAAGVSKSPKSPKSPKPTKSAKEKLTERAEDAKENLTKFVNSVNEAVKQLILTQIASGARVAAAAGAVMAAESFGLGEILCGSLYDIIGELVMIPVR